MDNVHHLHTDANAHARLLAQWIGETISQHPDATVAKRWSELARQTALKFPGPPTPTQSEIDLSSLDSLSEADKERVFAELQRFLSSYFDDVRIQLMQVHGELLALQKTVAELESHIQHPSSNQPFKE